MTNRNLKTSVALLALSGCAAEGVPAIGSLDAGAPAAGKEDAGAPGRGSGLQGDARVSDLLAIVICTALSLAGCDGGSGDLLPDAGLLDTQAATDIGKIDVLGDTGKGDTDNGGYTPEGVTANLGVNPCQNATQHPECSHPARCGWDPATNKCYTNDSSSHLVGICDEAKWCSNASYEPGTVLVWNQSDPRYVYRGDLSGGYICLLNVTTWCPSGDCCANSGCHSCTD